VTRGFRPCPPAGPEALAPGLAVLQVIAAQDLSNPGITSVAQFRWQEPADGSEAMAAQIRWHRTVMSRLARFSFLILIDRFATLDS